MIYPFGAPESRPVTVGIPGTYSDSGGIFTSSGNDYHSQSTGTTNVRHYSHGQPLSYPFQTAPGGQIPSPGQFTPSIPPHHHSQQKFISDAYIPARGCTVMGGGGSGGNGVGNNFSPIPSQPTADRSQRLQYMYDGASHVVHNGPIHAGPGGVPGAPVYVDKFMGSKTCSRSPDLQDVQQHYQTMSAGLQEPVDYSQLQQPNPPKKPMTYKWMQVKRGNTKAGTK